MTNKSRICSMAGMAIAGSLALGITSASAQAIYFDSYVDPYPVAVAPGSVYVAPAPVVAAPPIVRPRTVVVSRRAYVPAPAFGAPLPFDYGPYGYTTEVGYTVSDW
ncbi:hypothetical protein IVA95_00745 [Bradyrhizobium sp. 157]|uniref:hypothetical protein n=1 Tax=Bradyrhizobium sp. 157 TaxID=2782631 RepID=UPI001FF8F763|nr:hypothetical protein [Bradyrhizobium sp. 157]MCK1636145.1 hypothetical protein [Bradyrhizobium sp. 157]